MLGGGMRTFAVIGGGGIVGRPPVIGGGKSNLEKEPGGGIE